MTILTQKAKEFERAFNSMEGYEIIVSCANQEDAEYLKRLANDHKIENFTDDDAWSLIEVYQTKGNAA